MLYAIWPYAPKILYADQPGLASGEVLLGLFVLSVFSVLSVPFLVVCLSAYS
jgi:hypothetical protein